MNKIDVYINEGIPGRGRIPFNQNKLTGKYRINNDGNIQVQVRTENSLITRLITQQKYWYFWEPEMNFTFHEWDYYECTR